MIVDFGEVVAGARIDAADRGTVDLCAQDVYLDCPTREQRAWARGAAPTPQGRNARASCGSSGGPPVFDARGGGLRDAAAAWAPWSETWHHLRVRAAEEETRVDRIAAEGPNAQQIEYWNEVSGARWVEMNDVIDAQISPLGEVAIERAALARGEEVLDVGCGCGQTTLQLASRVGDTGAVTGIDISAVMLARARERAAEAGRGNVEFLNADAQTEALSGDRDLVFSRFGVMFFASPEAAFANLLKALRPGGRLTCLTWQGLAANPWMQVPLAAAAKHLPPKGPPPDPTAPGPFAYADSARVEGILAAAGFTEVGHESLERELLVGGGRSLDETVAFVAQLGPAAAALRDADEALRARVLSELRSALEPYYDGSGVRMPSAAWIVTARRPA